MGSLLHEKLTRRWPTERWAGLTVVVGCSGGADSTALLRALHELKPIDTTLIAAHFNHRLRGQESDGDEQFVRELADRLGCLFVTDAMASRGSAVANENGFGEAALREMRYAFLERVAAEQGARYVAVAHTADDSVETTLHNLVRGTGLAGLTGISLFRDLYSDLVLIRPIIDVWREEVIEYLEQEEQPYRIDSSNATHDYTRNRIRHRWLPMLEEDVGGDVRQAIHRTSSILMELQEWLQSQARSWLDVHLVSRTPTRVEIRVPKPINLEWPVVQHALTILWQRQEWPLMPMTQMHWNQLRSRFQFPAKDFPSFDLPSRIRVSRCEDRWVLERDGLK